QNVSPQTARNRLGGFMFSGEDVFKFVGDLSGGEKSRLRLCMLMDSEINLLILDEPTNHLDLPSREWIENAVDEYGETLLFISHDRYFINRFATRIWEIEDGVFTDFLGTFEQYIAAKESGKTKESDTKAIKKEPSAKAKLKRKPSDLQKELRKVERDIEKLEQEIARIGGAREEFSSDYEKLMELDEQERAAHEALDILMAQWEDLA
ncbi:MAG: ATP-binding cassette domain-containing protein, partial [Oscillospiraceae bacterium]|nr:ATP-binding cassette domain-containing protein [Oscillospiraceae bacterium]